LWHIAVETGNGEFLIAEIVFYSCSLGLVQDKNENSVVFFW